MTATVQRETAPLDPKTWREIVAPYQEPDLKRSVIQASTTLIPFFAMLYVMYRSLAYPYWVTLLLALPTAGLMVRTFIIMHDCGHGSYFPSRKVNDFIGFITGVLTLTPYVQWRRDHAIHHANSGDLEHRGHGDVYTLTVREYLAADKWTRLKYRLYRNPLVMFGLGPLHLAIGQRRRPPSTATGKKEIMSVRATNLALALGIAVAWYLTGSLLAVLQIYVPVFMIAGAAGIWLFYVQHQFEDTYWEPHHDWDYTTAAMHGSSYYKLPKILQWFTGNIGLHHVHHLNPRIPNYNLQRCHDENSIFHNVTVLTIADSIRTIRLKLWDEESRRMVGYDHLKRMKQENRTA